MDRESRDSRRGQVLWECRQQAGQDSLVFGQALHERLRASGFLVGKVGEAGMVSGNGESEREPGQPVPINCEGGSDPGVLDRFPAAAQARLKLRPVLAQIMPETGELTPFGGSEDRGK